MLQTQAVESRTLDILRKLMVVPSLADFQLVGGTALALKYGHRTSIDLDIFSHGSFHKERIEVELERIFRDRFLYKKTNSSWSLFAFIDDVKVDIIHYEHLLLEQPLEVEGIRVQYRRLYCKLSRKISKSAISNFRSHCPNLFHRCRSK